MRYLSYLKPLFWLSLVVSFSASAAAPYLGVWDTESATNGVPTHGTAALKGYVNTSFITLAPGITNTITAIQQGAADGMKSIVSVQGYFFSGNALLGTYTAWNGFVTAVNQDGIAGDIAAFYLYDEPNANGVTAAQLQIEANAVRAAFPGIPLMIVYSPGTYVGVNLVDWAGIDCYSNGAWTCQSQTYSNAYNNFRGNLTSSQRTVLIPQGGYPTNINTHCCDAQIEAEAQRYFDLSVGDPMVVAVLPFGYPNVDAVAGNGLVDPSNIGQLNFYESHLQALINYTFPTAYKPIWDFTQPGVANHFDTASVPEGIAANYDFMGLMYVLWNSEVAGSAPLYRCRTTTGHHFASREVGCEVSGYVNEGTYGYIYGTQVNGYIPLTRYYDATAGDYYDSTITTAPGGYTKIGVLGYINPAIGIP